MDMAIVSGVDKVEDKYFGLIEKRKNFVGLGGQISRVIMNRTGYRTVLKEYSASVYKRHLYTERTKGAANYCIGLNPL